MPEHAGAAEGWVSLGEAAALLGVSIYTVRRRVKRGELEAQQVPSPHGPMWMVRPGTVPGGVGTVSGMPERDGQGPALLEALAMIDRLQAELLARTEAAATWQARAELLAMQLEQARALPAPEPHQTGEAADLTAHAPEAPRAPSATPLPPWAKLPWLLLLTLVLAALIVLAIAASPAQ